MTVADIGWFTALVPPARLPPPLPRVGRPARPRPRPRSSATSRRAGTPASGWRWPSPPTPRCCSSTSRRPGSTCSPAASSSPASSTSPPTGRTVLISSHSIAELEKACTHVGLLRDGKMILSATLEEVRKKVRRLSLRFADRAARPGRPGHGPGAERHRAVLAGAGAGPGPGGASRRSARARRVRLRGRAGDARRGVRRGSWPAPPTARVAG